jgi:RNA polymerase sigma factor (TIGR02999 family)
LFDETEKSLGGNEVVIIFSMTDVTRILNQIEKGNSSDSNKLLQLVYEELRVLARDRLANEKPGLTLQATALVHEAYLRLVGTDQESHWNGRGHFFGAAAEAMRRILVEHARQKMAVKRGGDLNRQTLGDDLTMLPTDPGLLLDLNEAVDRLQEADEQAAELLKLLLFAGLSVAEGGRILGMSNKVAYKNWDYIRTWFVVHTDSPLS